MDYENTEISPTPTDESLKYLNGICFRSKQFTEENILGAKNLRLSGEDVVIVAFPKAGNTWMANIVFLLQNKGVYPEGFILPDCVPFLERAGVEHVQKKEAPRVIKSHLPFDMIPWSDEAKYIYLCRNPFDTCVSYFHHAKGAKGSLGDGKYDVGEDGVSELTFDEYFEIFFEGTHNYGDYFQHLKSWHPQTESSNVLLVTYEDLIEDTKTWICKVAQFLGGTAEENASKSDVLDRVIFNSSLKSMQEKGEYSFISYERPKDQPFLRRGIIGDYENYFSTDQIERLKGKFKTELDGTGAEFLWSQNGIPG